MNDNTCSTKSAASCGAPGRGGFINGKTFCKVTTKHINAKHPFAVLVSDSKALCLSGLKETITLIIHVSTNYLLIDSSVYETPTNARDKINS